MNNRFETHPPNQSTRPALMKNTPLWQPNYTISPATASGPMEIAATGSVLAQVPLPVAVHAELRRLDPRARTVLALFLRTDRITAADVAGALGLSDRMARVLLGRWVDAGWLAVADPSRRARAYLLSASYRQWAMGDCNLIGGRSQPRKPGNRPQPPQSEESRRA